ncbi:hypothetical protein M407DRAFT_140266 [Tulasnella calospora MUT 4182]|uniref:Uncharacterized protein n=1 Tax=Tulasnella calospora MUT 4182 TaxID=1051891 RepID=A0A0C3Q8N5_9AGAM|nr:hypothetical protein M407DRAFT_140266 [Tulasnella calospora MUT 4182]
MIDNPSCLMVSYTTHGSPTGQERPLTLRQSNQRKVRTQEKGERKQKQGTEILSRPSRHRTTVKQATRSVTFARKGEYEGEGKRGENKGDS